MFRCKRLLLASPWVDLGRRSDNILVAGKRTHSLDMSRIFNMHMLRVSMATVDLLLKTGNVTSPLSTYARYGADMIGLIRGWTGDGASWHDSKVPMDMYTNINEVQSLHHKVSVGRNCVAYYPYMSVHASRKVTQRACNSALGAMLYMDWKYNYTCVKHASASKSNECILHICNKPRLKVRCKFRG